MTLIPHLLIIMDGWGCAPADYPKEKNAIELADTPFYDKLIAECPNARLKCSGKNVGLPDGVMGNSEVGHLNIGAGRVVWQDIVRIDAAIEKDGLLSNEAMAGAVQRAIDNGTVLHLMGLVSDGAVHSVDRHYVAILRLAKKMGLPSDRVLVHCFLDGRDRPPQSGKKYVEDLVKIISDENLGRIATISGRYYAMDRDKRWDRTELAYDALINGKGVEATSPLETIAASYAEDPRGDEFVLPRVMLDENGAPIGKINSGDEVVFFNFRADRTRQLSHALVDDDFSGFARPEKTKIVLTTMTKYETGLDSQIAFPPQNLSNTLGEVVSKAGLKQLRIAETEKYAHVTYFFNGGREEPFEGEDRSLVPSPKVATYDKQPEMSAPEVAEKLEAAIRSGQYDLLVCNFANCDMVGHTGVLPAVVKAVETVDVALARVIPALLDMGGSALISADHGNAEQTWNFEIDCPDTQHTTYNSTPVILVGEAQKKATLRKDGALCDLAPTLWKLMGQEQPKEMDGSSLIV